MVSRAGAGAWARRTALALCLGAAKALAVGDEPPTPLREEVLAREVVVLLEPPRERAVASRSLQPGGLLVEEDGLPRNVANVMPLASDENWEIVVYLDRALASPSLGATAALALAATARQLAKLGTVEVVVADPSPWRLLGPASDAAEIAAGVSAGAAGLFGSRHTALSAAALSSAVVTPERAFMIRRQSDRLLAYLASRGNAVPRLLILVADGVALSPEALNLATGSLGVPTLPAEAAWVRCIAETSQTLGALGWTIGVFAPRVPSRKQPGGLNLSLGDAVDLRRLSLRRYATETGGTILGRDTELSAWLESLRDRWLLAYQSPLPRDGERHRVRVRTVSDGRELGGQLWTGGTLEAVTKARLRLLLAGDPPSLGVALAASAHRQGNEVVLSYGFSDSAAGPAGGSRLVVAYVAPTGEVETIGLPPNRGQAVVTGRVSWRTKLPATVTKIAVVLDDLERGTSAWAVVPVETAFP